MTKILSLGNQYALKYTFQGPQNLNCIRRSPWIPPHPTTPPTLWKGGKPQTHIWMCLSI